MKDTKRTTSIRVMSLIVAVFLFFCVPCLSLAAERTVYVDPAFSLGWRDGVRVVETVVPLSEFAEGNTAILNSFDAETLKKASPDIFTEELYGITPVVFVREGLTTSVSWNEVFSGTRKLYLPVSAKRRAVIAVSASYAVCGSSEQYSELIKQLKKISGKGKTTNKPEKADYIVDLDFAEYDGFSPVIPTEGTVRYAMCAVSKNSFPVTEADREYFRLRRADTVRTLSGGTVIDACEVGSDLFRSYSDAYVGMDGALGFGDYVISSSMILTAFPILGMMACVFFCGLIARRSMQKTFLRSVIATGIMISCWMTVRFIKWNTDGGSVLDRYLWYSYYVFFIFLPIIVLLMASKAGVAEDNGKPPLFWYGFVGVGAVLLTLIMTNDLHRLAFGINVDGYTYGAVYYVTAGFIFVTFFTALGLLYRKCFKSLYRPSLFYPIMLSVIPVVYWILYIKGVVLFRPNDIAFASSAFLVLTYAAVQKTGLVPCNVKYDKLFKNSTLAMEIIGSDAVTEYASSCFRRLTDGDFAAVCKGRTGFNAENYDNLLVSRSEIPGGFVIREEDMTLLSEDERMLKDAVDSLLSANSVLEKKERLASRTASEEIKKRLYDELDEKLREKLDDVRDMAANLPDEITDDNSAEYRMIVGAVGFTLCYIKRRCSFLFKRLNGKPLMSDDIVTCVSELCEFSTKLGVGCVPYQSITGDIEPSVCETVYDFCFSVLDFALKNDCGEMMLRFFRDGDTVKMSFIGDEGLSRYTVPENVTSKGSAVTPKDLGEAFSITLSVEGFTDEPNGGVS